MLPCREEDKSKKKTEMFDRREKYQRGRETEEQWEGEIDKERSRREERTFPPSIHRNETRGEDEKERKTKR